MILKQSILKAAVPFMAVKDVRFYLCGLHVRADRVEATNGHVAFVHKIDTPDAGMSDTIIPLDVVKAAAKAKLPRGVNAWELSVTGSGPERTCTLSAFGVASLMFRPIDGVFPDVSRVLPVTVSGEPACFDADYLGAVKHAAVTLGITLGNKYGARMAYNGENGPSVALIDDRTFCLVMPLRDMVAASGELADTSWAKHPPAVASAPVVAAA